MDDTHEKYYYIIHAYVLCTDLIQFARLLGHSRSPGSVGNVFNGQPITLAFVFDVIQFCLDLALEQPMTVYHAQSATHSEI